MIGTISGSNAIRIPYNKYFIHLRPGLDDEGAAFCQFLITTLGLRRVAVFYQNDIGFAFVKRAFNAVNVKLVANASYVRNTLDVEPALEKILSTSRPQGIFLCTKIKDN